MAGVIFHVNSGESTLVAATAKTCLQVKAATNQRVLVKSLRFFGKQPPGDTIAPVKVRMTRSTANFGTGGALTPAKNDPSDSETIQTTCTNLTTEPTSPTDGGLIWEITPQSGVIEFYPPDLLIKVPGGQAVNFEFTSAGTPIMLIDATCEE